MICSACEQSPGCKVCGSNMGERGTLRDALTGALIGLARATEGNDHMLRDSTATVTVEGLAAIANVHCDKETLLAIMGKVDTEKRKLVPECYQCAASCGRTNAYDMRKLKDAGEEVRCLKASLLFGIRGIAAYAQCAAALGYQEEAVHRFLYKALFAVGMDDWGAEELLPIVLEAGEVTRQCMALLDKANQEKPGHSQSIEACLTIENCPLYCHYRLRSPGEETAAGAARG